MALKSNREGLRKELVDYLGNIIIEGKLKQDIINLSSAFSIDLLWTNVNPNVEFAPQTISLDLSSYSAVYVSFKSGLIGDETATSIYRSCICIKNTSSNAPSFPIAQYCRAFSVDNSGITFEKGFYYSGYNGIGHIDSSSVAIPVEIYGIK